MGKLTQNIAAKLICAVLFESACGTHEPELFCHYRKKRPRGSADRVALRRNRALDREYRLPHIKSCQTGVSKRERRFDLPVRPASKDFSADGKNLQSGWCQVHACVHSIVHIGGPRQTVKHHQKIAGLGSGGTHWLFKGSQ